MSLIKAEAARRNGRLSRGPKTSEGRLKSAANSLKHGVTSEKLFVLNNESREGFDRLVATIHSLYQPMNDLETEICLDVAHARWRLRRIWTIETALFDKTMGAQDAQLREQFELFDEGTRLACAFEDLAQESRSLGLLTRYETRLRRAYDRALENLKSAQAQRRQIEAQCREMEERTDTGKLFLQNEPTAGHPAPELRAA
jgi:hypothetical protein